jgi:hypothetical protein
MVFTVEKCIYFDEAFDNDKISHTSLFIAHKWIRYELGREKVSSGFVLESSPFTSF